MTPTIYLFDFDSTIIDCEALDLLAQIKNDETISTQIKEITEKAMNGTYSFEEALKERIQILNPTIGDIETLKSELLHHITPSFARNKTFFEQNKDCIYIVSGGFVEYIKPVAKALGIHETHVFGNQFIIDQDVIKGIDSDNLLSKDQGKCKIVETIAPSSKKIIIGDGYTDYEVFLNQKADHFVAFAENVDRAFYDRIPNIDKVYSLDEFLYENNLTRSQAFPKSKINVLLLEGVDKDAISLLEKESYQVEYLKEALNEEELIQRIKKVHILGIRSKTQVTKKVLEHAPKLMSIGAFCIGTNQIDLEECTHRGISVFNAPYSNTRSVVELAIGEIILLIRNIPDKMHKMNQKIWDKSANGSKEIRGKKLGIIGYGNIGTQLSVLAESLGMEVYFYDREDKMPLGNAKKCEQLHQMLPLVDIVTIHIDGRKSNSSFFGTAEFELMKKDSIFLNLSRGHVVDLEALRVAMEKGIVSGAGIDVFPYEPTSNNESFESPLMGFDNLILTPHIGGSTLEAQKAIGQFVPTKMINYVNNGSTSGSVNFPELTLPMLENAHRFLHIHHNTPGILAKINLIFAQNNVNILGQYLKTNEKIGYVITDINKDYSNDIIEQLKQIEGTIKFRALY